MLKRNPAVLARSLAALTAGTPAMAKDPESWVRQVTPCVWATGIGGDIRPFASAPTVSFGSSFSEVLEDLGVAFFLSGHARRGRLVFLEDVSHSSLSRGGLIPPGVPAGGELEQTSLTLAAGDRGVAEDDIARDFLAGARHWRIKGPVDMPLVGHRPCRCRRLQRRLGSHQPDRRHAE